MIDLVAATGWVAGAIIAVAALPKIIHRIIYSFQESEIGLGDLIRDAMIVLGNFLWMLFGYFSSLFAIVTFCSINMVLTSVILTQNVKRKYFR